MSSILANYHEFNFSESYAYADMVRKSIFDENSIYEITDLASDLDNQIEKPQKWTLLHDYINQIVTEDINFNFGGPAWDFDCIEPLFPILKSHGINYKTLRQYVEDIYRKDDVDDAPEINDDMLEEHKAEYALDYFHDITLEGLVPVLAKVVNMTPTFKKQKTNRQNTNENIALITN